MNKRRIYLILQAAVCVALAALTAASAISLYREGAARKALEPLESIYTPQRVAERLAPLAPLFFAGLGLLVAGLLLGAKGEGGGKPSRGAYVPRERADALSPAPHASAPPKRLGILRAALLAAAAALIVAGVLNGSARDVLYKAITICTECVGLG